MPSTAPSEDPAVPLPDRGDQGYTQVERKVLAAAVPMQVIPLRNNKYTTKNTPAW